MSDRRGRCPRCGSRLSALKRSAATGGYYAECKACGLSGDQAPDAEAAAAAWNAMPKAMSSEEGR